MLKFVIFFLSLFSLTAYAQGMEGSPVSTPDTQADASRRSAEMWKEIDRQNQIARDKATRDLIHEKQIGKYEMNKSTGHFEFKKPYPVVVYDPNQGTQQTKQRSLISRIEVPASVKRSVRGLTRGLGANVLALAVYDLLGEGVGWLLDLDNHRVIYYPDSIDPNDSGKWCLYSHSQGMCLGEGTYASQLYSRAWGFDPNVHKVKGIVDSGTLESYDHRANGKPYLTFDVEIEHRTIVNLDPVEAELSLEVIAQKIHELAEERDNQAAKDFLQKLAEEAVKAGEFDDEIEKNIVDGDQLLDDIEALNNPKPTPTTPPKDEDKATLADEKEKEDDKTTSSSTGSSTFEFPEFCTWAKVVCDFLDNEEEDENNDFKFQDNDDKKPDTDFSFGGRCPANVVINGSLGPVKINFVLMEWTKFCSILTDYIKPAVIAIASYLAVLILAGRNESN